MSIDFRILGPLEVLDDGRVLPVEGAKQRALLALLVVHANQTLGIERLIDELWGERPPARATKTVQIHVSRLRKALERSVGERGGLVVTRDGGYQLKIEAEQVDAHRFERLVTEGRRAVGGGRPEAAVTLLEEALSLWRGPPLAEFTYERLAQAEVSRLDELRVGALEELVEAKLALGRHAEVVGTIEPLIHEHPYRERLRAQLMLALYRCDRQADALQAYQDTRRTLVNELGIEPGHRLRELEQAILGQDQALALADPPIAATGLNAYSQGSTFVGRERELAELLAGLDLACAGHGRVFLLVGEPGIGKSRLAEELAQHARARAMHVLVGRCWEAGGAPAFWPWVQSLSSSLEGADGDGLTAGFESQETTVPSALPELHELIPGAPAPRVPESEGARFQLFRATGEFLRRASSRRPIVLVLDDLHAADTPSLLLLQFLTRQLGSMHVLLLAAMRDIDPVPGEPLTAMLAEVAREPVARRISLKGLSEPEVERYIESASVQLASPAVISALYVRTEGNPLFVSESVRLLSLEGLPPEPGREMQLAIPPGVRDVISRRLARLSADCRRLLELASVLGREFALKSLARLGEVSLDELLTTLDEAMTGRVIIEVPGIGDRLRFGHVLIRDTLYEGIARADRVRSHRDAVAALEDLYGENPRGHLAELAHHSLAACDFDKAAHYAWRAADRALALLAYEEAARLYETALDAFGHTAGVDDKLRCDLLLSLGEAYGRAGNTRTAKTVFTEAAEIARQLELSHELARAALGYGGRTAWLRVTGDKRLVPLLDEALGAIGRDDVELRARLLARLAGALRDEPSRDRRERLSREAVELARRSSSSAALAYALDGACEVILAPDTIARCLALGNELLNVAERLGDSERIVHGHMDRFVVQVLHGDIPGAQIDLSAMKEIAEQLRQPVQLWQARIAQAMLALGVGALPEAEKLVTEALTLGEHAAPEMAIPAHHVQWYTLCEFNGQPQKAEALISGLVADYPSRPVFRCVRAHLHALLRVPEAGQEFAELAQEQLPFLPFDQEWLYGTCILSETAAMLGETDAAVGLYELLKPWEHLNSADHPEGMRGSVARHLGLLAGLAGRFDHASAHYENALAMNAKMGARPWLARTNYDYAQMLLKRHHIGDRQHALKLIDAAITTYRELGMDPWVTKASALLSS